MKRCAAALCVCLCVGARGAADSRFDEEPRDLVGLTVFVKDHGKGEVLDFARARIGASSCVPHSRAVPAPPRRRPPNAPHSHANAAIALPCPR